VGKIQEIIESRQAPGFLGLTDGHGALKNINSPRLKEKVKEQFKRYKDYLIAEEEEWNKPIPPLDTTKYKKVYWKEYFKDQDTGESIEIERSQVVDIDYELEINEYLK